MTANIIHFGQELCNRLPLLRSAGYSVSRYENFLDFRGALENGCEHDAVSLAEHEECVSQLVVQTARAYSPAPIILFRTRAVIRERAREDQVAGIPASDDANFDLVIPAADPPRTWIADVDALIVRSRELRKRAERARERSIQLHRELKEVVSRTHLEIQRSVLECTRNGASDILSAPIADRVLRCADCGTDFTFTAGEQLFFRLRNFTNDPKHCRRCRSIRHPGSSRARPETTVTCAECGSPTTVPFKPTQGRPVLCRACFERQRLMV